MIYSVLYAHLNKAYVKVGDTLVYGLKVGEMGNTGDVLPKPTPQNPNAGTHTHLSVVEGKKTGTWTLASMKSTNKPSQQQCKYFIEDDIFSTFDKTEITAGWLSYTNHYAYDIIPKNRKHYDLYWNRSFTGTVSAVGKNAGYGNYVIVQYDTSKKKTVEDLANEVIAGLWGKDQERVKRLTNAGHNYKEVQDKVNAILKPKETPKGDEKENSNTNTSSQLKAEISALKQELEQVKSEKEQMFAQNQSLIIQNNNLTQENENYIEQIGITEKNHIVELNKIKKEKQTLEDKIKLLELDKPKMIFNCQKDGMYRIRLKQNYKLYIKE